MGEKGHAPRQPADQRYHNAYLFGAICPAHGKGAALMLPWADAQAMQMHLDEISRHVARKAHAVVLMDRAGWHTTGKLKVPKNLTIILLPSRAPELNPVENIWQYLRANWLSNGRACSKTTMPSSMLDAKLGKSSSHSPKPSHQSECENGPISPNVKCRWYKVVTPPGGPVVTPLPKVVTHQPGEPKRDRAAYMRAYRTNRKSRSGKK